VRFLVDECFPVRLVQALRDKGHDVSWGSQVCRSRPDDFVLALATREGRIVITEDKDFGNLTVRDGLPAVGVVISQVDRFSGGIDDAINALIDRIETLGASLVGTITVVEPDRIRQRALPENGSGQDVTPQSASVDET
jgi:predicted nuclease of predicted toxin-antitoxin system